MSARARRLVAILVAAVTSGLAASAEPAAVRLTPDIVFAEDSSGALPTRPAFSPDGRKLAYLWADEAGPALWLLDVESRDTRRILDVAALAASEKPKVDGLQWAPDGDALLLEAGGDLHLLDLGSAEPRRLTETEAKEDDPKFSPDGSRLAFVRDYDLHVISLATGRETALTTGGEKNELIHGATDWVYWEEIWGRDATGYWWSPDGKRLAYYRFDETPVATYPLTDWSLAADGPAYPAVETQKYPKAGEANPRVRVGVLDLSTRATVWLDTGPEDEAYLARVDWLPSGERVAVQRLQRGQDRLDLLSCDPAGGGCEVLLTETWPTWVNLEKNFRLLDDGGFVWWSERDGWPRLYLYDGGGRLVRPITPEHLAVVSLDRVGPGRNRPDRDPAGREILYTAFQRGGLGASRRQVYRQPLDGGGEQPLAAEQGWNRVLAAGAGGFWLHEWSDADTPPRQVVRGADGVKMIALPAGEPAFAPGELPQWQWLTIPGPGTSRLPAMLLEPPELDRSRRHPVIMYQYGGPGSQVVSDRWDSRGRGLWHKMMAERGYLVLAVDNEASVFFGKRGEDRLHRRFGEVNLAAQLAAVDYLKTLAWADPGRIGLWGWSGGGSNTLYCVLNRPGVWKAAVSGAPVTDWRLYDTIWTERYLDHPAENPEGYRASSVLTHAGNLKDALLVVHGTADDNVHPQNAYVLFDAFVAAGLPFESALYPGQKHAFKPPAVRHFYDRMTEFFDRQLR